MSGQSASGRASSSSSCSDHLDAQRCHAESPLGGAAAQVLDGGVEVGGHGAPAREERIGLGRRADRLEGGNVEEVDLRAVHRIDVEGGEIGVHDEALDDQRVLQRGARHGIGILAELSEPPIEGVEPSAPCVEGFRRLVLEAVVESAVADRGGEGRVVLEGLVPEVVGELVEGGGFGGGGHPAIVPMRRVARRPFGP